MIVYTLLNIELNMRCTAGPQTYVELSVKQCTVYMMGSFFFFLPSIIKEEGR